LIHFYKREKYDNLLQFRLTSQAQQTVSGLLKIILYQQVFLQNNVEPSDAPSADVSTSVS